MKYKRNLILALITNFLYFFRYLGHLHLWEFGCHRCYTYCILQSYQIAKNSSHN